jgi:hypothetical protein
MDQGLLYRYLPEQKSETHRDLDAAYRPKIYYSDGPLKGQEEDFPPPNNMNRKLRSLASIQQIGKLCMQLTS